MSWDTFAASVKSSLESLTGIDTAIECNPDDKSTHWRIDGQPVKSHENLGFVFLMGDPIIKEYGYGCSIVRRVLIGVFCDIVRDSEKANKAANLQTAFEESWLKTALTTLPTDCLGWVYEKSQSRYVNEKVGGYYYYGVIMQVMLGG